VERIGSAPTSLATATVARTEAQAPIPARSTLPMGHGTEGHQPAEGPPVHKSPEEVTR